MKYNNNGINNNINYSALRVKYKRNYLLLCIEMNLLNGIVCMRLFKEYVLEIYIECCHKRLYFAVLLIKFFKQSYI